MVNFKHGHTSGGKGTPIKRSPEYIVWGSIKQRCYDPNCLSYKHYGAKGVIVCSRWLESFANFYADMGPRPRGTTLDRMDNSRGYEPGNCRWATNAQQQSNRSDTTFVEIDGERICTAQAATRFGIPPATFRRRVKNGWSAERALKTPPQKRW